MYILLAYFKMIVLCYFLILTCTFLTKINLLTYLLTICQRLVSDIDLFERFYDLFTDDLTYTDLTEDCLYDIFRQVKRLFLMTAVNEMRRQFVRDQGVLKN